MNERAAIEPGDLLSIAQARKLLPIGDTLMRKLVEDGEIRSVRIASVGSRRGRVLIERASLDRYVNRLRGDAPPRRPAAVDIDAIHAKVRRRLGAPGHEDNPDREET